ncbi:DNA-binding transcriptional regulator, LysR family [Roseovarius nanhaiticus]|uniref:DNA-binding transcriptional regulator, LysR family n=2 Tax=Roseovarius nanhaiticus TaxID=573024 RepID=A0A1N7FMH2_9RHOB|nr:DNA-binding transcriptional regulator, LysR family [Roseovarius nanhaiticus]SIS01447.1 DNA-binding transcriptional regulator, LysR family [Roseovarius nanhaiticus]
MRARNVNHVRARVTPRGGWGRLHGNGPIGQSRKGVPMAIKIEMLRCFQAVADHGSLTGAAEVLGRTPSAISMMLRQFEDHVGAPLFESARKSRLTPLGALIRIEAARELTHYAHTIEAIEALSRAQAGNVRLSCTPSVAGSVMPNILRDFIAARPGLRIDLRDTDSGTVQRDLIEGRADIGIATLPPLPGFRRELLFSDAFGVICPAGHPLTARWDSLSWADLASTEFIANGLCTQIHDADFQPILEASRLMVRNTASILSMVRAGAGVTILPELALPPEFRDLAFLPLAGSAVRREVFMVLPSAADMTPAAEALAEAIRSARISPAD